MTAENNIFVILDELVDSWCARRAHRQLRIILPAYPLTNALTDGWHQLYDALRDVRTFCKDDLNAEEQQKIGQVIVMLQGRLENR